MEETMKNRDVDLKKDTSGIMIAREKLFFGKFVEKMRRVPEPDHYYNHFPWQARIVVDNILTSAERNNEDVKIFLGDVNREFYGIDFFDRIREFAEKGCRFDIILAAPPEEKKLTAWHELAGIDGIRVRTKPEYSETLCHLVFSGSAYRIERPHGRLREGMEVTEVAPERNARFGFHENEYVRRLEAYWDQSVETTDLTEIVAA